MLLHVLEDLVACDLVLRLQGKEALSFGDVLGAQVRHLPLPLLLLVDLGPCLARFLLVRRVLLAVLGFVLLDLLDELLQVLEVGGRLGAVGKGIQVLLCALFGPDGLRQQLIDLYFAVHELI